MSEETMYPITREDVKYMEENDLRLVIMSVWALNENAPIHMWPLISTSCPYRGERPCVIAPKPTDGDPCICPHMAAGHDRFVFCSYKLPVEKVTEEEMDTFKFISLPPGKRIQ